MAASVACTLWLRWADNAQATINPTKAMMIAITTKSSTKVKPLFWQVRAVKDRISIDGWRNIFMVSLIRFGDAHEMCLTSPYKKPRERETHVFHHENKPRPPEKRLIKKFHLKLNSRGRSFLSVSPFSDDASFFP